MATESQLKMLVFQRGRIRAKITTVRKYFESCKIENTINSIIINQLKSRLEACVTGYSEFNKLQNEIEFLDPSDEQIAISEDFETNYFQLKAEIETFIENYNAQNSTLAPNQSTKSGVKLGLKLPEIQIRSFSGALEDWMEFHDSFSNMIHMNTDLSDIQKFHYLKSSLKGEAAEIIHSLQVTDSNYAVAWKLLCETFQDEKQIINNLINKLFQLSPVQKSSYDSLRSFVNSVLKNIRALNTMNEPTTDTLLIHLILSKLDNHTRDKWQEHSFKRDVSFNQLTEFLQDRCQLLKQRTNTQINEYQKKDNIKQEPKSSKVVSKSNIKTFSYASVLPTCYFCKKAHHIFQCKEFLALPQNKRMESVKDMRLCINCLAQNHSLKDCKSHSACRVCNEKHNTILHSDKTVVKTNTLSTNSQMANSSNIQDQMPCSSTTFSVTQGENDIKNIGLLPTAIIDILDFTGNSISCRVLLDSGAQTNFISKSLADRLNKKPRTISMSVTGIGQNSTAITQVITTTVKSKFNSFRSSQNFYVIDKIGQNLPGNSFSLENVHIPSNIVVQLADPEFYKSRPIDALLGAEIFWDLLCKEQIRSNNIVFHKTHLGWIVSGNVPLASNLSVVSCNLNINEQLNKSIKQFWELEEPDIQPKHLNNNEQFCEQHFKQNTTRADDGRFIVKLPFNSKKHELGESYVTAMNRFLSLERRLNKNTNLKSEYTSFMDEYEQLGHMTKIDQPSNEFKGYFIPHHCIIKESSTTTKLRVVFDASAKTTTGASLNDALEIGPVVQDDLFSIILRFRIHRFVLTADIAKMYRQVLVHEQDKHYQTILWRSDPSEPIETYQLNTITYGTASAPYLATRCLVELADQHEHEFPSECNILRKDFYVDDLLTGTDSAETAITCYQNLKSLLSLGQFELRKWKSNDKSISDAFTESDRLDHLVALDKTNSPTKTLGLLWDSQSDTLRYSVQLPPKQKVTKRSILSTISQIFDPLGLIGPVIVLAKLIMQQLWQLKIDWDDSVPTNIFLLWVKFQSNLSRINYINIDRRVIFHNNYKSIQLHAFCDASESAYGCSVYIRTTDQCNNHNTMLLCAKSRVAPLKSISLPRLELCGALLLVQLVSKVLKSLNVKFDQQFYWSDSTIVLAWINTEPSQLKTFVANRISEIQQSTKSSNWKHVRTEHNPADIISRGATPDDLAKSKLWWFGPQFLKFDESEWPSTTLNIQNVPEQKTVHAMPTTVENTIDLTERFSSLTKLKKVTALCIRFINNCRKHNKQGPITVDELENATTILIRMAQMHAFPNEITQLSASKHISTKSKLLSLNPFIDKDGLLRVGGRIRNANISFNQKHPIILPKGHPLTNLIINHEHLLHLHGGAQSVLAAIRLKYWPIDGKNTVKKILRNCIRCCRSNPVMLNNIMGDLPVNRINFSRPFTHTGVDFFGPFNLLVKRIRGARSHKAYVAIFICLSVKAVHLELVNDLSSESFIAALRRFTARRGKVKHLYSDNGTNFVGANNELTKIIDFLKSDKQINQTLLNHSVDWHFIPPRTPHFGGLWEAAVKSAKSRLKRTIGETILSYDEFITLITQVEACLNSRPLTPVSQDPNDIISLTPAHFLVGDSLSAVPELDVMQVSTNHLSRWEYVQRLQQQFWRRWSQEYLTQLQQRSKWRRHKSNVSAGSMVIIKDDTSPPLVWKLGRIVDASPGADGIIRVVRVKTAKGIIKVPIVRLCVLPISDTI